jgi:hypothetical protein
MVEEDVCDLQPRRDPVDDDHSSRDAGTLDKGPQVPAHELDADYEMQMSIIIQAPSLINENISSEVIL